MIEDLDERVRDAASHLRGAFPLDEEAEASDGDIDPGLDDPEDDILGDVEVPSFDE